MAKEKRKGLGRGLDALLGGAPLGLDQPAKAEPKATPEPVENALPDGSRLILLDPTAISPNPMQPRQHFNEEALQELADSIRRDGVQEPVLVRKVGDRYELIGGERRVRASIMADVKEIPAVCREVDDRDMLKLSLIENVQREDLSAIELAEAYQRLINEFQWTQEQLAQEVGKNRVTVTNTLRLLNLPQDVQQLVARGELTMGHARALLALETAQAQSAAARKIIAQGLSVRQAESLATAHKPDKSKKAAEKDPNVVSIEDELRRALGTKVALKPQKNGRGVLEIEYFNLDELERLLGILRGRGASPSRAASL